MSFLCPSFLYSQTGLSHILFDLSLAVVLLQLRVLFIRTSTESQIKGMSATKAQSTNFVGFPSFILPSPALTVL